MVQDIMIILEERRMKLHLESPDVNSLSALRQSIGQLQLSATCIRIQTTVISVDRNNVLMFKSLGIGAISQAFEDASILYTHTNHYCSRSQKWLATNAIHFIQGTGLEIHIKQYELDYDADVLRNTFFRIFNVKQ